MSDTNGKIKVIKNPNRSGPEEYKPYVPQYQVHGINPEEYHGAVVSSDTKIARPTPLPLDNPRAKRSAMSQPYSDILTSTLGNNPVPNVGNNMEHTWSGQIIDDVELDSNHPMIDNNDFINEDAFEFQNGITASNINPDFSPTIIQIDQDSKIIDNNSEDLISILSDLEEDSFLLIISGKPLCSGPKVEIEEQARAMVFGEHELCQGNPIEIDDIIILKRVKVKVGLFLE